MVVSLWLPFKTTNHRYPHKKTHPWSEVAFQGRVPSPLTRLSELIGSAPGDRCASRSINSVHAFYLPGFVSNMLNVLNMPMCPRVCLK